MFSLDIPLKASRDAFEFAAALSDMSSSATEVVFRRLTLMMTGKMSASDAVAMVTEKATAFNEASQHATMAAARGGDVFSIALAALGPYGLKTRANVERLRL